MGTVGDWHDPESGEATSCTAPTPSASVAIISEAVRAPPITGGGRPSISCWSSVRGNQGVSVSSEFTRVVGQSDLGRSSPDLRRFNPRTSLHTFLSGNGKFELPVKT